MIQFPDLNYSVDVGWIGPLKKGDGVENKNVWQIVAGSGVEMLALCDEIFGKPEDARTAALAGFEVSSKPEAVDWARRLIAWKRAVEVKG
jgi:hypothetical protein